MKIATAFLVAVTVLTRLQVSFTFSANLFSLAASEISKVVDTTGSRDDNLQNSGNDTFGLLDSTDKSKTGIESLVPKVGENKKSITKVKVDEAEKHLINKNVDLSEEALARAKKIVADALPNATGKTKACITAAGLWLESIQAICDILHPQMRYAIASSSVLALRTVVVELSEAIIANQVILVKFDIDFPAEEVKAGVSKEIKTILGYAIFDLGKIKEWLSEYSIDSLDV